MIDLFTPAPSRFEQWRKADCLRHAREWDEIAAEQPPTRGGMAFAAEARAIAARHRLEATEEAQDD